MRVFLKFVFGFLFVASVVVGAVLMQLHTRDLQKKWDPQKARKANAPIPVRTVSVMIRPVEDIIGGTAVTLPSSTATISILPRDNQIADRLVQLVHIEPGQEVREGETLIEFDRAMFEATVLERVAALRTARYEFQALSNLYEARTVSDLQRRESEMKVATAELQLKLAKYDLESCTVLSPLAGIVESTQVIPGMRVTGPTQMATIHRLDPIHVVMDFPMERLQSLSVGQETEVMLDAFPNQQFRGKVIRISTSADTRTRVLPVTIEVANPQNRIRAGITGYARIPAGKSNATTIPQIAVIDQRDKAMVFCVQDGHAKIREIETGGILRDGEVEVVRGLEPGEAVVVYGQDSLQDNDIVNADWKSWTNMDQDEGEPQESSEAVADHDPEFVRLKTPVPTP